MNPTTIITPAEAGPSSPSLGSGSRPASPAMTASQTLRKPASSGRLAMLLHPGRSRSGSSASQEATTITAYADDSGGNSGRSTPEQRRRTGKAAAASLLASDPKYKKFAALVDRCLQSFESVNEWADFISFLSRLLKALQSASPSYSEIPRKLIVAKRLAQCLNPALPSGVHQRALDVYAYIFSIIGTEGLKRDLLIWSSGLFPFFQFAATSVRPLLINIYETYYLPLGADLRPAAKALILALLPGLEEETGDFFDKILSLLSRFSDSISPSFFLRNMFLVLMSTLSARLAALNYLSRKLLQPADLPDGGIDTGLLIRGVAAVLEDEHVLVRRTGLDLLLRILPLSGKLFTGAEVRDQELLIRSASGVVLQRELSLSRRVYSWLLGPDDVSSAQIDHFKSHGLSLLCKTLQFDMENVNVLSDSGDAQRPFKIFLSMQDKWEIGSVLAERLAIPALSAIKSAITSSGGSSEQDMLRTASAVYEAVEPIVIWRSLFTVMRDELDKESAPGIGLIEWTLAAIPQHDEEVVQTHAPVLGEWLLEAALTRTLSPVSFGRTIDLASRFLTLIPPGLYTKSLAAGIAAEPSHQVVEQLYLDIEPALQPEDLRQRVAFEILPEIVTSAFKLSGFALRTRCKETQSLLKVLDVTSMLIDREATALRCVDSADWIVALLKGLEHSSSFAAVNSIVGCLLRASRSQLFSPPIEVSSNHLMTSILDALFRYLQPDAAPYHVRAVELIWEYNQLAEVHTLENVIARRMSSPASKLGAFEAFGVLWKLTDDSMLPGEVFRVPLFMMLDALKSTDPELQRTAETWMRCNLRSYFRALDPIIARLLEASDGSRLKASKSQPDLDFSWLAYLVESVITLLRFGGQGLSKACQTTDLSKSSHPTILQHTNDLGDALTYLDLLVHLLIRMSRAESSGGSPTATQLALRLQSIALEALQILVSKGDVSQPSLETIRLHLVDKLSKAIHRRQTTLQSKMLHLLHTAMSASDTPQRHHRSAAAPEKSDATSTDLESDFEAAVVSVIVEGVSSASNQPILQHWVDFVLMTSNHLSRRGELLESLNTCFASQLRSVMSKLRIVYDQSPVSDVRTSTSEAEPIMLLNALERVVMLLASLHTSRRSEDGSRPGNEGGSMILGLVSGVFGADGSSSSEIRHENVQYLDDAMSALLVTWTVTADSSAADGPAAASREHTFSRTRLRARKVLEKVFKAQPSAIMGTLVRIWASNFKDIDVAEIFGCVDVLTPSAQRVVEMIGEVYSTRQSRASTTSEQQAHPAYLAFLEAYISRLEAPIAVQVWSTMFVLARDLFGGANSPSAKAQLYPVLRCLTALAKTVATTSALEDRRLRRDLQETYVKILDAVTSYGSRTGDFAIYDRGLFSSRKTLSNGDVEKLEDGQLATGDGARRVSEYVADEVVPNLRSFLHESERVAAACSGISTTIIAPAFRQQKVDSTILRLLLEMTKLPTATKAWRFQVAEAFNDQKFFRMREDEAVMWKPLICALMDGDKERFGELLGRIAAAPSANIFTNREQEMISRSLNLRRLSFVLLAAERNHYLAQLPSIQEKLVDILRTTVVSPRVHSEVYLCLRILMCRISPQHLTNFWPVILAELLRVFEATMDEPPPDGSEQLQLVLAACKFLDLLLVIQSEDFQVHQWMFVTDTTDAVYPPEDFSPEAIMDRLNEIISEHAHDHKLPDQIPILDILNGDNGGLRRPRLSHFRTVTSLHQLQPFLSRASIDTYEGVYSRADVDWEAVEEGLSGEIFDVEGVTRPGTPRLA